MREADDDKGQVSGEVIASRLQRLLRLMRANEHSAGLNPAQWEALRFVARANRFSNVPSVLTKYLGATKGTVSQTVKTLEKKGLIVKSRRPDERRSVALMLTPQGQAVLELDPWRRLVMSADELGNKARRRLGRNLAEMLEAEVARAGLPHFGICVSCRFFRERGRESHARGPHLCMLFDEPISSEEAGQLCSSHEYQA
ncbi:MAG: MarR family transcriptional regulator [Rhizobiales bacterium]|nr:MarR family transcriptional regulator [Hyphomicrobiales bacterium]